MSADFDNVGTTAIRSGFALDEPSLALWLTEHVAGYRGPLQIEQFKGGQSNPTFKLMTRDRCYVLRRQPSGPMLKGAHAIEREARVIGALGKAGFPVPFVHAVCMDDAVIGSRFYVMDMVEGRIFWDAALPGLTPEDRNLVFESMNETLASLHMTDIAAVGLEDYGRSGNYIERQVRRWTKQYLADTEAGGDPHMDRLIDWLPANVPTVTRTGLVHGDFRIDNLIFDPVEPKVIAVLDWELSTLGDPLADFSYNAMMYHMPPDIVAGLLGQDLAAIGIPSEREYIQAYCKRTGLDGIPHYDFYLVFNFFRLAAIFHGIKGRTLRGTAASAQSAMRAQSFPILAAIAWQRACEA